jgi:hypothetical protein
MNINVTLYDISYSSVREISQLIKNIDPISIVFLGYRSLMELILLRISKNLNVKTIYLEHGLYTKDTESLNRGNLFNNPVKTLKKYLFFLFKYFQLTLYFSFKEIKYFRECFLKNNFRDNKFDEAIFFAEYGFQKLNPVFDYDRNNIHFCGYPLFKDENDKIHVDKIGSGVLYVHQPFILNNQTKIDYDNEKKYIIELKNTFSTNSDFTLLLHPRESKNKYIELFQEENIKVVQKPNEFRVFLENRLVIGHYSTALFYPLYFKIDTIIIDYPGVVIDPIFTDYCLYLKSIDKYEPNKITPKPNISNLLGTKNTYSNISFIINDLCNAKFFKKN